jgi:hypothetical protein
MRFERKLYTFNMLINYYHCFFWVSFMFYVKYKIETYLFGFKYEFVVSDKKKCIQIPIVQC